LLKELLDNRREKTTITLPHWIKALAEKEGINFSRLLETALKETLSIAR
jgi:post-segregation antitoxin (ccd killing protein)